MLDKKFHEQIYEMLEQIKNILQLQKEGFGK
jgi:hypothetical protein